MIFPGGCAERDELRLRHMIIKKTTKTASARTTAMAIPAMYPALLAVDALGARAGMSGGIADALPSAITYGSLSAEAVAMDSSCKNRESNEGHETD
jgi:hypothetical protein